VTSAAGQIDNLTSDYLQRCLEDKSWKVRMAPFQNLWPSRKEIGYLRGCSTLRRLLVDRTGVLGDIVQMG
jgi:hypothetical protein